MPYRLRSCRPMCRRSAVPRRLSHRFRQAMAARDTVQIAKGHLMGQDGLEEDAALQTAIMRTRRTGQPLVKVADDVLRMSTIDRPAAPVHPRPGPGTGRLRGPRPTPLQSRGVAVELSAAGWGNRCNPPVEVVTGHLYRLRLGAGARLP